MCAVSSSGITINAEPNNIIVDGIKSVAQARAAYAFILEALKFGGISVTKIVGLSFRDASMLFSTGMRTKENFADVMSNISKLHLRGWSTALPYNLVIRLKPGVKGTVTSDDVTIGTAEKVDIGVEFIEHKVKLFTLNDSNIDELYGADSSAGLDLIDVIVLNEHALKTSANIRKIIRQKRNDIDVSGDTVYIDTLFSLGDCLSILPVNISKNDVYPGYSEKVHLVGSTLSIPIRFKYGVTPDFINEMLTCAIKGYQPYELNGSTRGLLSNLSKENYDEAEI